MKIWIVQLRSVEPVRLQELEISTSLAVYSRGSLVQNTVWFLIFNVIVNHMKKKVYRLTVSSWARASFASKVNGSYGAYLSYSDYLNFDWGYNCWCCKYLRVQVSKLL